MGKLFNKVEDKENSKSYFTFMIPIKTKRLNRKAKRIQVGCHEIKDPIPSHSFA